jgi:Secretion system C-terminal sorting domain/PA14 domain/CotH kinase protein
LLRKMGSKDVHVRFVNVFMNGIYWGVFPLREKFDANYAASYYGGNDVDYDYLKTEDVQFNWPADNQVFVDPGDGSLTQYQGVLAARNAKNYQDLKQKLDVTHLTNTVLMFVAGSAEPEHKAIIGANYKTPMTFYTKDMDAYMDNLSVPYYNQLFQLNISSNIQGPHNLLALSGLGGTEVPNLEYQTLVRDRFQLVYLENTGAMSVDTINALYRRGENIIKNSMPLEIARWNRSTYSGWLSRNSATVDGMTNRIAQVISKFRLYNLAHTLSAVTLSKASGSVNVGEKIFITNPNPNTTVYYTLDGTDVVLENTLSPTALLYNAATGLDLPLGKMKLRARAYTPGNFGMYAEADYVVARPIKITSIAYQPNLIAPAPDVATNDVYEFFYLTNAGASAIDISNFMVTEAIDTFRFPVGTSIVGGETIMMCADDTRYPSLQLRKFKWAKGKLANGGENISFRDAVGNLVNEVKFDTLSPWPYAKGNGLYLRLKSISADNSKGGNWEAIPLTDLTPSTLIQNVENFRATPLTTDVVLNWSIPTIGFDEICIVAKEGTGFSTKPNANTAYTADANFTGGGSVFEGGKVVYKSVSGTSVTVSNLTRGKTYYFRAYIRKGTTFTEGVETIAVMPAVCQATGQLLREIWNNVPGVCVSNIPVFTVPSATAVQSLAVFESPRNIGDNFGVRYRGYICAPETGNYTFFMASDNSGEFWLSTDDNAANKQRVAYIPNCSYAGVREWTKFPEQKSALISLVAGQKYYIEALYKEADSGDALSVGWQKPSTPTVIEVIPGSILAPYGAALSAPQLVSNLVFQVEGHQEGQKAVINWVSNANAQADYYIVEKRVGDKGNFEEFQVVNAQYSTGNNALHYYTIADNAPEKDKIAYRVGMALHNSPPQYSAPISLDFTHFTDYAVYPNPATEKVIVDLSNVLNLPTKVLLTDFMGRTIVQTSFDNAPNTVSLDLSSITTGQYFIRIQAKGKREVMKKLAVIR